MACFHPRCFQFKLWQQQQQQRDKNYESTKQQMHPIHQRSYFHGCNYCQLAQHRYELKWRRKWLLEGRKSGGYHVCVLISLYYRCQWHSRTFSRPFQVYYLFYHFSLSGKKRTLHAHKTGTWEQVFTRHCSNSKKQNYFYAQLEHCDKSS